MRTEALVLLEGDRGEDARRLVATWPTVGVRPDAEFFSDWERISGVNRYDIERIEPILFENGILGPEGYVDPAATAFIEAHLAAYLERVEKRARR